MRIGLWSRLIKDLRLLWSLMKDYWAGRYRQVSVASVVLFVLTTAYILSPFDFISDFFPVIGQLDDALLLGLCLFLMEKELYRYQAWKRGEE